MNKNLTVLESILVVQQIASAALYLQECGYIHSNISSHNILVRERPWSVKLSSFELATDIDCADIQAEVEINCPQWSMSKLFFDDSKAQQSTDPEEKDSFLKDHYMEMSKRPPASKKSSNPQHEFMSTPSKYLIYDTSYRQCLSLHNFLAPEFLQPDQRFVFPTTKTDVYSLCLLLWEILNKCVPFAVYGKLDMERMIATNKLNLPFFERERCSYFMEIFHFGLSIKPENRYSVDQLIEMLEDIELEILTVCGEISPESKNVKAVDNTPIHTYENVPQSVPEQSVIDVVVSSVINEQEQLNMTKGNASGFAINDLVLSPSLLDFNKSLTKNERTSTRKFRKKAQSKCLQQITELFTTVNDSPDVGTSDDMEKLSFVDLNENFSEEDYHILDSPCEDEKLSINLADLAKYIRHNLLDNTKEVILKAKTDHEPLLKESEVPTNMPIEEQKFTPAVVGFSKKSDKPEPPELSSGATRKLFTSINEPLQSLYRFDSEEYSLPPIARQNYIRRNAWLSQQSSSNNEYEEKRNEIGNEATPLQDDKRLNVSVRIVHNKLTPKKVDDGRPSILSKINFFNSTTETAKPCNRLFNDKCLITPVKRDDISSNNLSRKGAATMLNEPISELPAEKYESGVRSGMFSNEKTTIIKELKETITNSEKNSVDQPQHLFENKLWKKELNICNRSFTSNDGDNNSKVVTPKWRSVRDTVMKFEKRGEFTKTQLSTQTTPTELVKHLPTTPQHPRNSNVITFNIC